MELGVPQLVRRLCECVATQCEKDVQNRRRNLLVFPDHIHKPCFPNRDTVLTHLYRTAYDLLLLRRKEWYGRWSSDMSPECQCLAKTYVLHEMGRVSDSKRLAKAVSLLMETVSEPQKVCQLLASLATQPRLQPSKDLCQFMSGNSAYPLFPHSLFTQPPEESMYLLMGTNDLSRARVMKMIPGSGFTGFYSQKELTDELSPVPSTLFDGLTHTDTSSVNVSLQVPPLSFQAPDLLQRLLHQRSAWKEKPSDLDLSNDKSTTVDDFLSLIDSVGFVGGPQEPLSWEGSVPCTTPKYLSVAGGDAFRHAQQLYTDTLARVAGTDCPTLHTDLKHITASTKTLHSCMHNGKGSFKGLDEMQQSFGLAVQNLVSYCCVLLDQHIELGSSQLTLQSSLNTLLPVMQFASQQVQHSTSLSKGLDLLEELYQCCLDTQGLASYPLFLGLFKQTLGPYLRFLDCWVFRGKASMSDVFGLLVNDEFLSKRDYRYWSDGFRLAEGGVPMFLSRHANLILDTGKVLNLLRLCCPKHHLCSGEHQLPQLSFSLSLTELTLTQARFEEYRQQMEGLAIEMTQRRRGKQLERELSFMAPLIRARQEARRMMALVKERERSLLVQEAEKKSNVMTQLKHEMERAKALRLEEEQQEKDRDREMMAALSQQDHESTARERTLKQEARESMEAHYQQLSQQAELRVLRARWRAKRMSLGLQRLHQMEREVERYEEELRSKSEPALEQACTVRHNKDLVVDEHMEVLDIESPLAEIVSDVHDNRSPPTELASPELHEMEVSKNTAAPDMVASTVSQKVLNSMENSRKANDIRPVNGLDSMENSRKIDGTEPVNGLTMHMVSVEERPCQAKEILYDGVSNAVENHKTTQDSKSDSVMQDTLHGGQEEHRKELTSNSMEPTIKAGEQPCQAKEILYGSISGTMEKHKTTQHSKSDSVMQNIIYGSWGEPKRELTSGTEERTVRTREPPCQVKEILYGGVDDAMKEHTTSQSSKPDSVMQDILYGGCEEPRSKLASAPVEPWLAVCVTRGPPPSSVVQELLYPDIQGREEKEIKVNGLGKDEGTRGREGVEQVRDDGNQERDNEQDSTGGSQESNPPITIPDVPHEASIKDLGPSPVEEMAQSETRPYSHFQDDFSVLSQPPFTSTRLLMFAGPSDNKPDSDAPSCSSLFPLQVLVDQCIVQPILTQARLVNNAIVEHFLMDLKLMEHFSALKRYLLMEDGEFARAFSSQLFHQLMYGHSLDQLCSASFLNPLLSTAIECSLSRDSEYTERLSLGLVYQPRNILKSSIDALDFLQLSYKVQWPYSIVIHADSITKYNVVFQFLLKIKRTSWVLTKVFNVLSKGDIRRWMSDTQLRMVHAQRQELQHFVVVMEGYITNQLFHLSWRELETRLKEVKSLDELIQCHNEFLDNIMFRCLLSRNPEKGVMKVIQNMLSYIMTFSTQLLVGHPNMAVLSKLRKSFAEASKILLKVVVTLAEKGFQPHLEEFILRLNYNHFYQT